jgi:hypothetical protein
MFAFYKPAVTREQATLIIIRVQQRVDKITEVYFGLTGDEHRFWQS